MQSASKIRFRKINENEWNKVSHFFKDEKSELDVLRLVCIVVENCVDDETLINFFLHSPERILLQKQNICLDTSE